MTSEDPRSLYIQEVKMKPSIRIDYFPSWKIADKLQTNLYFELHYKSTIKSSSESLHSNEITSKNTNYISNSLDFIFFFSTDHYTKARIELHRSVNLSTKS